MSRKNKKGISSHSIDITSTISVTLLLILLGIIGLFSIVTYNVSNSIKEKVGFSVVLEDSISQQDIDQIQKDFKAKEYVSDISFISKQDAARQWKEETGEDLIELFEVNPLQNEIEVRVKAQWASTDSINNIVSGLNRDKRIESIAIQSDIVDQLNHNINIITLILLIIAIALVLISFMLINNTIKLSIHSHRFIIHTMKLVGATASFIRRPFILSNALAGFIAAMIAILVVGYGFISFAGLESEIAQSISLASIGILAGSLIIIGILICSLSAHFATTRYIRLGYDKMFK